MSQYQPMYDTFQREARDRYVPSSRIGVSSGVFLPSGEIDMGNGAAKQGAPRRRRVQAENIAKAHAEKIESKRQKVLEHEKNKTGVRVGILNAVVICAALVIACLFTLNYQLSTLQGIQDQRNRIDADTTAYESRYNDLKEEYLLACSETTICYAAAQDLKMIPAEAAEAVHLVPVDTRPLLTASQNPQNVTAELTVQTTQIPAIASAGN